MYKNVGMCDFMYEFRGTQYQNNIRYEGLQALFEYIEEYEEVEGHEIELDIVAIACDWTEYEDINEIKKYYNVESIEELEEQTVVIEVKNGHLIILDF